MLNVGFPKMQPVIWPGPRTWDLDIDNVDDLVAFLDSIGTTVDEFKTWPVYIWNVEKPGMEWLRDL